MALMDVLGPQGALTFSAPADQFPEGTSPQTHGAYTLALADGETRVETYEKNDMFLDEIQHFVDCVEGDTQPLVTGTDGKRAIEIGFAILESSKRGDSVAITLA